MKKDKINYINSIQLEEYNVELKKLEKMKRRGIIYWLIFPFFGMFIYFWCYNRRTEMPKFQDPIDSIKLKIAHEELKLLKNIN
ncbi:hypothetical protein [Spiroplasma endosymbiont of Labia minor]|uniref:hypothetical protein n=1 Tax=Spiroplasma endosymbiont of Labia minor TaxID=3066305 RepID=UPI0030CFB577